MNKSENKLTKLLEIIRKDTGVNNAIDAIEQLSLIIFLKYLHECILNFDYFLNDTIKSEYSRKFSELFYSSGKFHRDEISFYTLKNALKNIPTNTDILNKAESILSEIPFRLRSEKVLRALLYKIEQIDFIDINAEDYDSLINDMVNSSVSSSIFYSPDALVRTISKVMKPVFGETIYDPALGTGGFLIEAQKLLQINQNEHFMDHSDFYGKDISPFAFLVSSLRLLLNGFNVNNITLGDSLLDADSSSYDIVMSAPPFGKTSNVDKYQYEYDEYTSNLESMFLMLSMKKLKQGGRAAIIMPEVALFGTANQLVQLRRKLLTKFNLHSILSLPSSSLFPNVGVKISVLFFDNTTPTENVWFYELEAEKPYTKTRQLSDADLVDFINLFPSKAEGKNSFLVGKKDIINSKTLNLSFKRPNNSDEASYLNIYNGIELLQDKTTNIVVLLSEFTNLLAKNKKVEFVKKITIGEVFKTKAGQKLDRSEIKNSSQYPVYGANGVIGYSNYFNRDGENILIGRVGAYCGNVYYTQGPIWLTDNSFSIQLSSSDNIYMPYLAYVLRSLDLNKFARGSAQPSISFSKIKDAQINLPFYEQQVELAEWFDDIRQLEISLHKSIQLKTELLSQLTESIIVSNCVIDKS